MLWTERETIAKTDVFIQAKVTTSTPQDILSPTVDDLQSLCRTSEEGEYANHACSPREEPQWSKQLPSIRDSSNTIKPCILISTGKTL